MYLHGRWYKTESINEAMTLEALTNHRPLRSRTAVIVDAVIRHILLLPAWIVVGLMAWMAAEYAIHYISMAL